MKKMERDTVFYKKLFELMIPIMLQNLMLALVAVADAFMLGGVDQNYMSAVSLATQIQFIQNMFLTAATASLGSLGAQYWGKGDLKTLDDIFCMALRLCGLVSVVFFAACMFIPKYLMILFTNESVLIGYGVDYLRIAAFSYLLTGISQCYLVIMKTSEHAKTTAIISSFTVCINILLNAVFIYGWFGIRTDGRKGRCACDAHIPHTGTCDFGRDLLYAGVYLSEACGSVPAEQAAGTGFPEMRAAASRRKSVLGIGFTSYSSFMGHLGVDAAAANSVAAVVRDIICCLSAGISSAAAIMVGNELGSGNLEKGKTYGIRLLKISLVCGIVMSLLMCVVAPFILRFVNLSPQAASYLKGMFVVIAVYMIGRAINDVTMNGIFASGGDTMFDFYSLAVCMWGIVRSSCGCGHLLFSLAGGCGLCVYLY